MEKLKWTHRIKAIESQTMSEPTVAYISDSGGVKITRALCGWENRRKQHGGRREKILLQANLFLLLVDRFCDSLGTASRLDPEGCVFNRFR